MVNFLQLTSIMDSLMSIFMKKVFKPLDRVVGDCSRKYFVNLGLLIYLIANLLNRSYKYIFMYFRLKGHRGESQILRGNRDFPSSDDWSWNPGEVKSVRKCDSCQKCSRHNVGYKPNSISMGQI